jgi:DNA-binding MarR family transcriptional regulator
VQSEVDKREFHLEVTDKYLDYYNMSSGYIDDVMERLEKRLTPEELQTVEKALQIMSEELMPEIEVGNAKQ